MDFNPLYSPGSSSGFNSNLLGLSSDVTTPDLYAVQPFKESTCTPWNKNLPWQATSSRNILKHVKSRDETMFNQTKKLFIKSERILTEPEELPPLQESQSAVRMRNGLRFE